MINHNIQRLIRFLLHNLYSNLTTLCNIVLQIQIVEKGSEKLAIRNSQFGIWN